MLPSSQFLLNRLFVFTMHFGDYKDYVLVLAKSPLGFNAQRGFLDHLAEVDSHAATSAPQVAPAMPVQLAKAEHAVLDQGQRSTNCSANVCSDSDRTCVLPDAFYSVIAHFLSPFVGLEATPLGAKVRPANGVIVA